VRTISARPAAAKVAPARLGLAGLPRKVHEYGLNPSGGQRKRVAITGTLAMDPKIMPFDKVTSAPDSGPVG
jgi:ABC-type polar amino acid transport system ATPase subunit